MNEWIDIEWLRPNEGERVICLIPFGMRVVDDSYTEGVFANHSNEHISHWKPINAPGSYVEIMNRPKGPLGPLPPMQEYKTTFNDDIYTKAVIEHIKMMDSITSTQFLLRLEERL